MSNQSLRRNSAPKPTPAQKRRAQWDQLVLSLPVPQRTSIATPQPPKARPAHGAFATQ